MTKAARIVAKATGITIKEARRVLIELGTKEFHHTSKFYNAAKYYDTKRAIDMILHGNPDYTDNIESDKFEAEHEIIKAKRAACKHEWTGKSYRWYCPKCGETDHKYERPE